MQAEHTLMFDEGERKEKERISSMSTSGRVTDLLPKVLDDLNQKGLTTNTTANKLESKNTFFLPHSSLVQTKFCIIADRSGLRCMVDGRITS